MRLLTTLFALILPFIQLNAQSAYELIKENRDRASGHYHVYETFGDLSMTPAPKGYTPFYISHYGRHGSRFHASTKYYAPVAEMLDKSHDAGILTARGEELRSDVHTAMDYMEGMEETLTHKGCLQHAAIATRMQNRFPEVFSRKDRYLVSSVSSVKLRCLQSMAAFTTALARTGCSITEYSHTTGPRYMKTIANGGIDIGNARIAEIRNRMIQDTDCSRLERIYFTDRTKAGEIASGIYVKDYHGKINLKAFFYYLFRAAIIRENLDDNTPDLLKDFDTDELYRYWYADNTRIYSIFGRTEEFGNGSGTAGEPLLKDIIEKADKAVRGNNVAADLRFGHDTGVNPLAQFIRLKGQDKTYPAAEASNYWWGFKEVPMASNIQFVFYRNKSGNVLVKILSNESETTIDAVPTFKGPYYKWDDLRNYFLKVIDSL